MAGTKNDLSTKSSTLIEDREPIPSFLKALSYQHNEFTEEGDPLLD